MRLTFLGKDSKPDESPTLYATDQDSYVIQGWIVTDIAILSQLDLHDHETVVEVPSQLLSHLNKNGLEGDVAHIAPPIVHVKEDGNYLMQGQRVTDSETLSQMDIPSHETCVNIPRLAIERLLETG
ncbi:hypothetical protein GCM10022402_27680 [Salinactinospora qingdaonensis]|uniref:Uncharacterized protein n=2 Tax=Salinactinospora qingdaonensis TaxID=702744 RepID=A0ABP7FRQ8_9ACTN